MPADLKYSPAKKAAQQAIDQEKCSQTVAGSAIHGIGELRSSQQAQAVPWTLADEQEKNFYHHQEQARKAEQAMTFLRDNPAFGEFIRLVRQGVIQF